MRRCKKCVNELSRERYRSKYQDKLRAARRAKHHEKVNKQVALTEVERAYAAGLIDGEGCIRMTQRGKNGGKAFWSGQFTLMVELTNTSKAMTDWLLERLGGTVSYCKAEPHRNARERWHWRVAANKALYTLDAIWPYVIVKRAQAKLGRRFQRYAQYAGRAQTERVAELHKRFYDEFASLNARGLRAQMTNLQPQL